MDLNRYGPALSPSSDDVEDAKWANKQAENGKWARGEAKKGVGMWKGVFAPHHSIFEEDITNLPATVNQKATNDVSEILPKS